MAWAEGFSEERDKKYLPCNAGAAIAPFRICQKDGSDPTEVKPATSGTQFPFGVSGDGSEAGVTTYVENNPVQLVYEGIAYVSMDGSGNQGDRIIATTAGQGVKHTSGDDVYVFGHAMKNWVDNDVIPVMIQRYYIGDFNNT